MLPIVLLGVALVAASLIGFAVAIRNAADVPDHIDID